MKRSVIAVAAVAGLASAANAQVFDIVMSETTVDVSGGAAQVEFAMFFDTLGATEIDAGGAGFQPFFGWAGLNGVFSATGGSFQLIAETDDDAAGGTVSTPFGAGAIAPTDWFGRAPGTAAVNGSDGEVPPFGTVADLAFGTDGSGGSFRFGNAEPNYEVRDGGLTLGFTSGAISGAQAPAAVGGTGQDTSPRIEVFRGVIQFDENDVGIQDIDFVGLASFFIESGLSGFTSVGLANQGGTVEVVPTPASLALLGLGGLAANRRRR